MTEVQEPQNQTALDVFNASFNDLQARMANNEVNLQTAHQQLGRILKFAENNNLEKIAQSARATWQHTLSLYEGNQQAFAALQGAQVAIEHVEQQRRAIAEEYNGLMKAIADEDETHPALEGYAQEIRDEAYHDAEELVEEGIAETLAENLHSQFGWSFALAGHYAGELIHLVYSLGDLPDDHPRVRALRRFVKLFPLPDWVQRYESMEQQWTANSTDLALADDEEVLDVND